MRGLAHRRFPNAPACRERAARASGPDSFVACAAKAKLSPDAIPPGSVMSMPKASVSSPMNRRPCCARPSSIARPSSAPRANSRSAPRRPIVFATRSPPNWPARAGSCRRPGALAGFAVSPRAIHPGLRLHLKRFTRFGASSPPWASPRRKPIGRIAGGKPQGLRGKPLRRAGSLSRSSSPESDPANCASRAASSGTISSRGFRSPGVPKRDADLVSSGDHPVGGKGEGLRRAC